MPTHTVKKNETLSCIARKYKLTVKSIINANEKTHPGLINNPNVILEGWTLTIPDIEKKQVSLSTGTQNMCMKLNDPKQYLRLSFEDPGHYINLQNTELHINGTKVDIDKPASKEMSVAGNATIVKTLKPIPENVGGYSKTSKIVLAIKELNDKDEWVERKEEILLDIGGLDPISDKSESTSECATDKEAKSAVQKLLSNLGYYITGESIVPSAPAKIDGDLSSQYSIAAIKSFQNDYLNDKKKVTGIADSETCRQLVYAAGDDMGNIKGVSKQQRSSNDKNFPLLNDSYSRASQFKYKTLGIGNVENFDEHTAHNPLSAKPESTSLNSKNLLFPRELFVSPCFETPDQDYSSNANKIKKLIRRFIFMDCGRWIGDHRDIGFVFGRHVYLCTYGKEGKPFDENNCVRKSGKDYDFFKKVPGINIVHHATAHWGLEDEFDWEHVHVIIPDLHLMEGTVGKIWRGKDKFNLNPELDLLRFAHAINDLSYVNVIQIGDSYDLWVGCGFAKDSLIRNVRRFAGNPILFDSPLFEKNNQQKFSLLYDSNEYYYEVHDDYKFNDEVPSPSDTGVIDSASAIEIIEKFINDIRGWNSDWVRQVLIGQDIPKEMVQRNKFLENPAITALELLKSKTTYIYGNHDNYLIQPAICRKANLKQRVAYFESKSFYIEHAHRMEAFFTHTFPKNFDGNHSGFEATCDVFLHKKYKTSGRQINWGEDGADDFAMKHDQPAYIREFARFKFGRGITKKRTSQNIFAIGHTHVPCLHYVSFDNSSPDKHWAEKYTRKWSEGVVTTASMTQLYRQ